MNWPVTSEWSNQRPQVLPQKNRMVQCLPYFAEYTWDQES